MSKNNKDNHQENDDWIEKIYSRAREEGLIKLNLKEKNENID